MVSIHLPRDICLAFGSKTKPMLKKRRVYKGGTQHIYLKRLDGLGQRTLVLGLYEFAIGVYQSLLILDISYARSSGR